MAIPALAQIAQITVYADRQIERTPILQGFLTGIGHRKEDQFDTQKILALKPQSWRIPDWVYYDKISPYKPKITFILGEQYANLKGGWNKARPWENWTEWETFVKQAVEFSKNNNKPVDFWDVWGEPDLGGGTPWEGSYSDFLELFARTITTIHSVDPAAKVVGPSVSEFNPRFNDGSRVIAGLDTFLSDLDQRHHVRPDAVSWHELGSLPEDVPAHAQAFRAFLATAMPEYHPAFHINEFTSEPEHLIPGWTVGWLYYLEQAKIDSANRACWSVQVPRRKPWSDCWAGLNGLFLKDNKTPQMNYWVHLAYGQMGATRLVSEASDPRVVAIASKDEATGEIMLLVGRFDSRTKVKGSLKDVRVNIKKYPYKVASVQVEVQRIASDRFGVGVPGKPEIISGIVPIKEGSIFLDQKGFQDGDVYVIRIKKPQN